MRQLAAEGAKPPAPKGPVCQLFKVVAEGEIEKKTLRPKIENEKQRSCEAAKLLAAKAALPKATLVLRSRIGEANPKGVWRSQTCFGAGFLKAADKKIKLLSNQVKINVLQQIKGKIYLFKANL